MESQPKNPEFRNNPENFTHVIYIDLDRQKNLSINLRIFVYLFLFIFVNVSNKGTGDTACQLKLIRVFCCLQVL